MNIYIDESGAFLVPPAKSNYVCCVGALVVPETRCSAVFADFCALRVGWPNRGGETKGSLLSESEIAQVVEMLLCHDVLYEVTAIDMSLEVDDQITRHKMAQAAKITANITPEFGEQLVEDLWMLRRTTERTPNQLYVQSVATFELIHRVLQNTTLYYCQRTPEELSAFHWVIDAKGKTVTEAEDWWSKVIMPFLQTRSFREPFISMVGGDYSYFARFQGTSNESPNHLKELAPDAKPFHFVDIKAIFTESFSFRSSDTELGLQLADVLTNAVRRAMVGNLRYAGWKDLGGLIIQRPGGQNVQLISLTEDPPPPGTKFPYHETLRRLDLGAKSIAG